MWLQVSVDLLIGRSGALASFQPEISISTGREASNSRTSKATQAEVGSRLLARPQVRAGRAEDDHQSRPQGLKDRESRTVRAASSSESLGQKEMSLSLACTVARDFPRNTV